MEIQVFADLLVGGATLILAIVAIWGLNETRAQQRIISKQLEIQQSQLRPNLQVKAFHFKENILTVEFENVSTVAAYWVGVLTRFYLIYPQYFENQESKVPLSRSRVEQMESEKKQLYVKYQLYSPNDQPRLVHDNAEVKPSEAVIFAGKDLPGAIILSRESRTINLEPVLFASTGSLLGTVGKAYNFVEFKGFLLQHDIHLIAFSFELICKDVTEAIIRSEWITKFAVNIGAASSFEDAFSHSNPVFFLPLSAAEIQDQGRFLPGLSYRNMKTPH